MNDTYLVLARCLVTGKAMHADRATAGRVLARMRRNGSLARRLTVFRCAYCEAYHLGNRYRR